MSQENKNTVVENPALKVQALMAAGAEFEVVNQKIDGVEHSVFKNIPANMHGLYKAGLDYSERTFLVYEDVRWSFEETYLRAASIAQQLQTRFGVQKGDRVALASRNYPEWIAAYMATTLMGAVIVPMNSWWVGSELEFGLKDSGAKVLIGDRQRIESVADKMDSMDIHVIALRCPELVSDTMTDINSLMEGWQNAQAPEVDVAPDDWATLLYTSGSTGNPKGVMSTHRNVLSQIYSLFFGVKVASILAGANTEQDKASQTQSTMLLALPLFHVTGCNVQFLPSFLAGRKLVMMYKWDATKALQLIEQEKITGFAGVPTMGQDLIEHPDFNKYDTSSLKELSSGGAPKPPEQVKQMNAKAPQVRPGVGYGLTETNGVVTSMSGADYLKYPAACGRVIPPLNRVKIVKEDGSDAQLQEWGEVWIKSAAVMKGYWKREQATSEVLTPDGWFKTGDIGYMNEAGYLFLVDRAKDLVIRGGENIGCAEVEGAIAKHEAVMEVAVYGLPHQRLGETVGATVMLKPDGILSEQELQAFLKQHLAHFKIPEHIFFQNEPLPRGATEKIYKKGIREQAVKTLML